MIANYKELKKKIEASRTPRINLLWECKYALMKLLKKQKYKGYAVSVNELEEKLVVYWNEIPKEPPNKFDMFEISNLEMPRD